MFNPCLIIPIYNHGDMIGTTVARLLPYQLPIIIVDDGSDPATEQQLQQLAAEHTQVQLFRLSHNQGKGVAVCRALFEADAQGFSHALQVDADGQHDIADVAKLLQRARQHPNALISGRPAYDQSVPKARLYGRYITHFWVWIETLSFMIKDSMCGFRAYPVAPCIKLLDHQSVGQRMDFDTEIMVRLYWQGLDINYFPTRVTYPEQGVSHFHAWKDNWLISKMHTRLCFGMLARLPRLIGRHFKKPQHWSEQTERGSQCALRLTLKLYQLLGQRGARLLLYPVMAYFFLFVGRARRSSAAYLQQLSFYAQQHDLPSPPPGLRTHFGHFLAFGQSILDKLAVWMGEIRHDQVVFHHREEVVAQLERGQGLVMIGSHLGNLEICRAIGNALPDITINALVFSEHAQQFNRVLEEANPDARLNLIQVSSLGPEMAITLRDKVDAGEILVIVADRTSVTARERVLMQPFLGRMAPFPEGPFVLASLMQCPVYLLFCLRRNHHFEVTFEPFASPRLELPRGQRPQALQQAAQRYAQRLQHYCLSAPLQWFNFFDFWHVHSPSRTEHDTRQQ